MTGRPPLPPGRPLPKSLSRGERDLKTFRIFPLPPRGRGIKGERPLKKVSRGKGERPTRLRGSDSIVKYRIFK